MGVETVKTLTEISVELIQNLLGKNGTEIWRRANGIEETPVVPFHEQKSISTENIFQQATIYEFPQQRVSENDRTHSL